MLPLILATLVVFLAAGPILADEPSKSLSAAAMQYDALVKRFQETGRSPELVQEFLTLAREHPDDPAAVAALYWLIVHVRDSEQAETAVEWLLSEHIGRQEFASIGPELIKTPSLCGEKLLRGLEANSPHPSIRSRACFFLAEQLRELLRLRQSVSAQPVARRRFEQFYGKPFTAKLIQREPDELSAEAEQYFDRLLNHHSEVDDQFQTLAHSRLTELRHLTVGKPAMEIEGEDVFGKPLKLSDYRGKVVLLSFWGHW